MFKEYLLLLLLGHILGDFYTQTAKIAEKKKYCFKWVLIHGLIYFLTVVVISTPVMSTNVLFLDVTASFLHALIDILKFEYLKGKRKEIPSMFIVDQCLHFVCLVGISYMWVRSNVQMEEVKIISDFFDTINVSEVLICTWVLAILTVHKPANILIQNLIGTYKPKVIDNEIKADNNAGRVIGTVERIIMLSIDLCKSILSYRSCFDSKIHCTI